MHELDGVALPSQCWCLVTIRVRLVRSPFVARDSSLKVVFRPVLAWRALAALGVVILTACANGPQSPLVLLTVSMVGDGSGVVTSTPAGINCSRNGGASSGSCSASFGKGVEVTLFATPSASNHSLREWSGGCSGVAECTVTMNSAHEVTATFDAPKELRVLHAGTGSGSVSSSTGGITCTRVNGVTSGSCVGSYVHGATVTLSSTPSENHSFNGWSVPRCDVSLSCAITMTAMVEVTATFTAPCVVTVAAIPAAGGTVAGGAIVPCAQPHTVTASPSTGWRFVEWREGNTVLSSAATYVFSPQTSRLLTAVFVPLPTLTVATAGTGNGTVTSTPAGINCDRTAGSQSGTCSFAFGFGASITVNGVPSPQHQFAGWSGACAGSGGCQLTMNADQSITASFAPIMHVIAVSANPPSGGTVTGPGTYAVGSTVTLTAAANAGFTFVNWTEGGTVVSASATFTFIATAARTLVAHFAPHRVLTLDGAGNGSGTVSGPGIWCTITLGNATGDCSESYATNTNVALSAAASTGDSFDGWSGACSGTGVCIVVMAADRVLVASFSRSPTLTISITGSGSGQVTSIPTGINCSRSGGTQSGACSAPFMVNTGVALTAVATSGFFAAWSGAPCGGTSVCQLTMSQTWGVTAVFATGPTVATPLHGLDFGPYINSSENPDQGTVLSEQQVRDRMQMVVGVTYRIRSFGSTRGLEHAGRIAHELGREVACGAWLDSVPADDQEVAALITAANAGHCDMLVVGSELLRRVPSAGDYLAQRIAEVKNATTGIPVTTGEIYGNLIANPQVLQAVDVVFANFYPFWEGIHIEDAIWRLNGAYDELVSASGGKRVIISETGWPSCGTPRGAADPSQANASQYLLNFVSWAKARGVEYYYFEALNEPWKASTDEGDVGPCWGVFTESGSLKPGVATALSGATVPDNWSGATVLDGPGTPEISFTNVPTLGNGTDLLEGRVSHVAPASYRVAVFIKVNGVWWTKPTFADRRIPIRASGRWFADIVTGGADSLATEIRAYLMPAGINPDSAGGSADIPANVTANAVASIAVVRSAPRSPSRKPELE